MAELKVILEEKGELKEHSFPDGEAITIGRTADNAVRISDALSSRQHCKIRPDNGDFVVEDLKSRNGTKLNGEPLTAERVLEPGDRIEVGESIIHFGERKGAKSAAGKGKGGRQPGAPLKPSDPVRLIVAAPADEKGTQARVKSLPFVIGRKDGAGLVLQSAEVSTEHLMIVEDDGVLHAVDLGSKNGTHINGKKLTGRAVLRRGSVIRLGNSVKIAVLPKPEGGTAATKAKPRPKPKPEPEPKSAPPPEAEELVPGDAVEEITDLDALEDDDDAPSPTAAVAAPPKPVAKPRASTAAARRGSAKLRDEASAVLAQEGDVLDDEFDFAGRLEAAAGDGGGGGGALGAIVVVLVSLLVAGSVLYVAAGILLETGPSDPPEPGNLIAAEHWSFESPTPDGSLVGWELEGDGWRAVSGPDAVYGQSCLEVVADSEAPQAVRAGAPVTVIPGRRYRARVGIDAAQAAGVMVRVDWGSDADQGFQRSSVAVVFPPGEGVRAGWRDVSGVVEAPRGATQARLACVPLGDGKLRLDHVVLTEAGSEEPLEWRGPAGSSLTFDERGVFTITRQGRELAHDVRVALSSGQTISAQSAGRLDQPLASQTDGSLLALISILEQSMEERQDVAFFAKQLSEGIEVRWSFRPGAKLEPALELDVSRLGDLAPFTVTTAEGTVEVGAQGEHQGVRSFAWGDGVDKITFRLLAPATLTTAPLGAGVRITLVMPPRDLAANEVGVGFDIVSPRVGAQAEVEAAWQAAEQARRDGDVQGAIALFDDLARDYQQIDPGTARRARRQAEDLLERARRGVDFVSWARSQIETMDPAILETAAEKAIEELERDFGARAKEVSEAKNLLADLRKRRKAADQRDALQEATALKVEADGHRAANRDELARLLYEEILRRFGDLDLAPVKDARDRLKALKGGN